jgi:hypothetical protein
VLEKRKDWHDDYIARFLERWRLKRRAVTHVESPKAPPPEAIVRQLKEIHAKIAAGGYTADRIFSADETACNWREPPSYAIVAEGTNRASSKGSDEKSRFTVMLAANADASIVCTPRLFSIRCSVKGEDQSRVKVLRDLHKVRSWLLQRGH